MEGNEDSILNMINDESTYYYLIWVLKDFDNLLKQKYKTENPLRKYDVFLISLFASLGYCHNKNPELLKKKIKVLIDSFKTQSDPLRLGVFSDIYSRFKTGIGDKRRRFIFETFRSYFLSVEGVDNLEWEYAYDKIL